MDWYLIFMNRRSVEAMSKRFIGKVVWKKNTNNKVINGSFIYTQTQHLYWDNICNWLSTEAKFLPLNSCSTLRWDCPWNCWVELQWRYKQIQNGRPFPYDKGTKGPNRIDLIVLLWSCNVCMHGGGQVGSYLTCILMLLESYLSPIS